MAEDQEFVLPPLEERPLVTFALFAYNQEKYIREAVEGAFAQTYEPLEIILSDDCSTDRTFEIMEEMAAGYAGPHRLIVRQNHRNLGLIDHVNAVLDSAAGEFIALAAGDDISLCNRVQRIVSCFMDSADVMLVHSQTRLIDENSSEVGLREPPITDINSDPAVLALVDRIYIGATGAIRSCVYSVFGPISEAETYEDLTFGFRAALIGNHIYVAEPLVKYRCNVGLSSRFSRWEGSRLSCRIASIRHQIATLRQRSKDLSCTEHPSRRAVAREIDRQIAITQARLELHTAPFAFLSGFFSKGVYCSIKAISSELKFMLRMMLD